MMNIRMDERLRHHINVLATMWRTTQAGVIDELVRSYYRDHQDLARVAETPATYGRPSEVQQEIASPDRDINPDDDEDGGMPRQIIRDGDGAPLETLIA